jgi:hypothetical protein
MLKSDFILTASEAVILADFYKSAGDDESATLLKIYASDYNSSEGDLIKQAGFFGNLLKRLKGFGKKVFFKVYRELYERAELSQEKINNRIEELLETKKQLSQHIKLHDLESWRGAVSKLKLADEEEITRDFDKAYGKLIQYLGLTNEKKEEDEIEESEKAIEQLPDLEKKQIKNKEQGGEKFRVQDAEKGWRRFDPKTRSFQVNTQTGQVRIETERFNRLLGVHLDAVGLNKVKLIEHSNKGVKYPEHLKDLLKNDVWDVVVKEDYTYLTKSVSESSNSNVSEKQEVYPKEFDIEPNVNVDMKEYMENLKKTTPAVQKEKEEFLNSPTEFGGSYVKTNPIKKELVKNEPIKEEPVKEEPVKEELVKEEPVKDPLKNNPNFRRDVTKSIMAPQKKNNEVEEIKKSEEAKEENKPKEPNASLQKVWVKMLSGKFFDRVQRTVNKKEENYDPYSLVKKDYAKKLINEKKAEEVNNPELVRLLNKIIPHRSPEHSPGSGNVPVHRNFKKFEEMLNNVWSKTENNDEIG